MRRIIYSLRTMEPRTTLVLLLVCFIVPQGGIAFKGFFKWLFRSSGKAIQHTPPLPAFTPVRSQIFKIPRSDFGDFPSSKWTTQVDNVDDTLFKTQAKDTTSFFLENMIEATPSDDSNYGRNRTSFLDIVLRNHRERSRFLDERKNSNGNVIYGDTENKKWDESRSEGEMDDDSSKKNGTCEFPVSNETCFIPNLHVYYDPLLKRCKREFGTSKGCQKGNRFRSQEECRLKCMSGKDNKFS